MCPRSVSIYDKLVGRTDSDSRSSFIKKSLRLSPRTIRSNSENIAEIGGFSKSRQTLNPTVDNREKVDL